MPKKSELKTLYITDRELWRDWLCVHHDKEREIWLVFYKKHTGKPSLPLEDAIEEALCFGWIDSLVRRLDDDSYARKFTPRTNPAKWSAVNIERMRRLLAQNLVRPMGLAVFDNALLKAPPPSRKSDLPVSPPEVIMTALKANRKAWKNFDALAPSAKRNYVGWIMSAKREETRNRRIAEIISLLEQGKKLGLK